MILHNNDSSNINNDEFVNEERQESHNNDNYDQSIRNSSETVKVFSKKNIKNAFISNKKFLIRSGILVLILIIILGIVVLITNNQ